MTQKTKELFEALTLLRYAAEHETNDISKEDIQIAYYRLFDILDSLKYIEDQNEQLQTYEKEQQKRMNKIHKKVVENFGEMDAPKIASDMIEKMKNLKITKSYVVSEMSNGTIAIVEGSSDPNNKKILRYYTDIYDYQANIDEDLKCDFKRKKLFEDIKTLKKGDHD